MLPNDPTIFPMFKNKKYGSKRDSTPGKGIALHIN